MTTSKERYVKHWGSGRVGKVIQKDNQPYCHVEMVDGATCYIYSGELRDIAEKEYQAHVEAHKGPS